MPYHEQIPQQWKHMYQLSHHQVWQPCQIELTISYVSRDIALSDDSVNWSLVDHLMVYIFPVYYGPPLLLSLQEPYPQITFTICLPILFTEVHHPVVENLLHVLLPIMIWHCGY
jgi:hypothetical protein